MIAHPVEVRSECQSSVRISLRCHNSPFSRRDEAQPSQNSLHSFTIAAVGLALLLLSCQLIAGCHSQPGVLPRIGNLSVDAGAVAEKLRTLVSPRTSSGSHSASFIVDRLNAQKVYQAIQYSPAWIRDGQVTPQALAIISALENSRQKGLNPEDYEESQWPARLAALNASSGNAETVAQFDSIVADLGPCHHPGRATGDVYSC